MVDVAAIARRKLYAAGLVPELANQLLERLQEEGALAEFFNWSHAYYDEGTACLELRGHWGMHTVHAAFNSGSLEYVEINGVQL